MHQPPDYLDLEIIVARNGEVSNRWSDGTVGVPAELADAEETLYHPEVKQETTAWRDVWTNDTGAFLGFAV